MEAAVIAIGDEITSGQRVDTNSAWLSQRLSELGIPVAVHLTAADELQACADVFRFAVAQADVVVATGGLGPTADDLTREAIAMASGRPLRLDESALSSIRQLFESRGRTMPERNRLQAMFPEGSAVISNPHGTAPGIDLSVEMKNGNSRTLDAAKPAQDGSPSRRTRIVALPGVPAEMREMWHASVASSLTSRDRSGRTIVHRRVKCFGIGESACESMIPDLIARGREPRVGITVHRATITLRITAFGDSEDACHSAIQPTLQTIREQLGSLVFGEEDDELQHAVIRHLSAHDASLSVLETDTHGLLSHWLSSADGDEQTNVFLGGLTDRSSNHSKGSRGGGMMVAPMTAHHTLQAAWEVRQRFGATHGLAVGRFPENELEEFQVALATEDASCDQVVAHNFAGHPDLRIERSVKQAMDVVRRHLMGQPRETT